MPPEPYWPAPIVPDIQRSTEQMQNGCVTQFVHTQAPRRDDDDAGDDDKRHGGCQVPKRDMDAYRLGSRAGHKNLNDEAGSRERHQLPGQGRVQQA